MKFCLLMCALVVLVPRSVWSQCPNTVPECPVALNVSGPALDAVVSGSRSIARYYSWRVAPNRSYCVETAQAAGETEAALGAITVFREDGTTVIGSGSPLTPDEPGMLLHSRFCYINTTSDVGHRARVDADGAVTTDFRTIRVRVVDNTLFCPGWWLDPEHDAFMELHNTNGRSPAVTFTVTLRDGSGAVVGTPFTSAPGPNAIVRLEFKNTFGLTSGWGSAEIASTSAPGMLVTTLTSWNQFPGVNTWTERRCETRQQPAW